MRFFLAQSRAQPAHNIKQITESQATLLTHCLLFGVQLGASLLKLVDFTLQPPDPLVGGREVVFQLLEYGAGMLGQVRQLSQGPRQSHITDGDQILEQQTLLVWDLIPAQQLGFHDAFGKWHVVVVDRGINPTKVTQEWARSSSLPSAPDPVFLNSASAAAADAPHPFIC